MTVIDTSFTGLYRAQTQCFSRFCLQTSLALDSGIQRRISARSEWCGLLIRILKGLTIETCYKYRLRRGLSMLVESWRQLWGFARALLGHHPLCGERFVKDLHRLRHHFVHFFLWWADERFNFCRLLPFSPVSFDTSIILPSSFYFSSRHHVMPKKLKNE